MKLARIFRRWISHLFETGGILFQVIAMLPKSWFSNGPMQGLDHIPTPSIAKALSSNDLPCPLGILQQADTWLAWLGLRMLTNSFAARELGREAMTFNLSPSIKAAVAFYRAASLTFEIDGDSSSETITASLGFGNVVRGSPWGGYGSLFGPKLAQATGQMYRAYLDLTIELTTQQVRVIDEKAAGEPALHGMRRTLAIENKKEKWGADDDSSVAVVL